MTPWMVGVLGVLAGAAVGWLAAFWRRRRDQQMMTDARQQARRLVDDAARDAAVCRKDAELAAKELLLEAQTSAEAAVVQRRAEVADRELRLQQRETQLERRITTADRRESELHHRERAVIDREKSAVEKEGRYSDLVKEQQRILERTAGLSAEEATARLTALMEEAAKIEAAKRLRQIEAETKEAAERRARELIVDAMQRVTGDCVAEATISVVQLPSDEMKGRIIGKEGRNIRALEAATGVDVIVDDTPEAVVISGFDPLRREIARVALERLMADGRIHPPRIEEVVEKVKKEMDEYMVSEAEKVLLELSIQGLHPELVKTLGRLRFRTSYGQNNLFHAREAAYLCGMMAHELGLDVKLARRGALLHDIGKSLSHEEEGTHPNLGAELARRYGESSKVVNAIAAHHGDIEFICPEAALVAIAEGLSAARPGARREQHAAYIKRLQQLEGLATSYTGVDKAYAIRAGREVRVILHHEELSDAQAAHIARDLAHRIEKEMTYPGQIKVTVIRESRYIETAK
ncbi:MAG TPA: ribonuclease Y [Nitrospiria bacterium]|nr:ribonuclease Y [Nitrospiria bacterium]